MEFKPPFSVRMTAVYHQIVDAEGSLVAFIGIRDNSKNVADRIARLLNEDAANSR